MNSIDPLFVLQNVAKQELHKNVNLKNFKIGVIYRAQPKKHIVLKVQ